MKNRKAHIILFSGLFNKKACFLLLFLWLAGHQAFAQAKPSEYQLKAIFLYNFTRFINWPPAVYDGTAGAFEIGIIGEDPFGSYLDEIVKGEKIGELPITIKRYQDVRDIQNCRVIYINSHEESRIREVLAAVSNRSILTVSDAPSFLQQGGIIRFFTENNKIRMQINKMAAEREKLNISSKLLSVSQVVNLNGR